MYFFNKVLYKVKSGKTFGILATLFVFSLIEILAQTPNYSAWHYKDANYQANKRANSGFVQQSIDSFVVKWATPFISGDITPLIGNILDNSYENVSLSQPLEIIALMGDEIILISGSGKLLKKQKLPMYAQNVKDFTLLFDSLNPGIDNFSNNTLLIGSESIEYFNPNSKDTLAHSYIFGYDSEMDSIKAVKRLSIDLRKYKPNVSASIKPFWGRSVNGRLMVHAIVDMDKPFRNEDSSVSKLPPPFFRGYAQFYDDNDGALFPLPDMKDQENSRIHISGNVGLYQPSIQLLATNRTGVLLPYQSMNTNIDSLFKDSVIIQNVAGSNFSTNSDSTYLLGFNVTQSNINSNFSPVNLNINGTLPIIRPIYAELTNANSTKQNYILVSEQYSGIDGSVGESRLHLYNNSGVSITGTPQSSIPPLSGGMNHYWSVAVGNVDGISTNSWNKYFPNNAGNEIVVTQSTKEAVFPESKLFIMRYNTGTAIEKPTPSGDTLFPFDTIATSRVNGWLAAVADIDLMADGKDEIFLVDGSKLMILRMRDYADINFRLGYPFDTVLVKEFRKQTISNVAIADLEGDGKPDIIITTFDSTYIIGAIISNTIRLNCPEKNGVPSFCINDTINLSWQNIIISQQNIRIKFERLENGIIKDTINVADLVNNNSDSLIYKIFVDNKYFEDIIGKTVSGRFIIEGIDYPDKLNAISCMMDLNLPEYNFTSIFPDSLTVGDNFVITADLSCVDSVNFTLSFEQMMFDSVGITIPVENNQIYFSSYISCVDNLFSCQDNISDIKRIYTRIIFKKNLVSDTIFVNGIKVLPKKFLISIDEKLTADPTIYIRWNPSEIMNSQICENISVSVSDDGANNFSEIGNVDVSLGVFEWNVPYNVKDELIFRLCCAESSCFRIDTLVSGIKPEFVGIIAPNPFNPELEQVEFVYKIPKDMNITISIYDQSNRLVRQILKNEARKADIVYTDRWDGTRSDGNFAANGLYYLTLDLSDGTREIHQIFLSK